jgi:poly(A) polymerase
MASLSIPVSISVSALDEPTTKAPVNTARHGGTRRAALQPVPDTSLQEQTAVLRDEMAPVASENAYAPEPVKRHVYIPRNRIDLDALKVIRRLVQHGHVAYLVGGGVRDLLLGRNPKDFDVATSARPPAVRRLFRNGRLIGRRFRLAHILFPGGKIIEVATFRRDPNGADHLTERIAESANEADALHPSPVVEDAVEGRVDDAELLIRWDNVFGNPHEDAVRRDFTINGLFYDVERQEVIDYVGGLPDLRDGVVRTIGKPEISFREDPVRILRAIKFSARLDMGIEPSVYDAMVALVGGLRRAAPARLLEETLRLMRGGAAHRSIYLAWDVGALGVIFPELVAFLEDQPDGSEPLWRRLSAVDQAFREGKLPSDTVLLSAVLFEPLWEASRDEDGGENWSFSGEILDQIAERLAIPRKMKLRIHKIVTALDDLQRGKIRQLTSTDYFNDAVSLLELQCQAEGRDLPEWLSRRKQLQSYRRRSRSRHATGQYERG